MRVSATMPILFFLLAASSIPTSAAETAPTKPVVKQAVARLGANKFVVRENATQELLEIGAVALPLLKEATKSSDQEIRERSKRIVALLREQSREAELATFRRGNGHLPGWKEFSSEYGEGELPREIFAQIAEAEGKLFDSVFSAGVDNPLVGRLVTKRIYALQHNYQQQRLGTMLGLVFVATQFPDHVSHLHIYPFTRHHKMQALLNPRMASPPTESKLVRTLVGKWLLSNDNSANDQLFLQTAMMYRLDEGKVIGRRVLANKVMPASAKKFAMETLVMLDDEQATELIEPFLEDARVLGRVGTRERQLRDVALACLVLANKQDLSKIQVSLAPGSTQVFNYRTLGYTSESDRQQALKYYRSVKAQGFPQGDQRSSDGK